MTQKHTSKLINNLAIDGFYDADGKPLPSREEIAETLALKQNTVRNVSNVVYCNMKFKTWFRSPLYFDRDFLASNGTGEIKSLSTTAQPAPSAATKKITHPIQSKSIHLAKEDTVIDTLHICDTCFAYTDDATAMASHKPKCIYKKELPGRVVYDSPYYQIRKVDGAKHPYYSQFLCLFAKLFLDSKSVFFSVQNFDFYVLTISLVNIRVIDILASNYPKTKSLKGAAGYTKEERELLARLESESSLSGQRVIGFFSKEKISFDKYNLACINVFPPFQKRGLGRLLISYSYYLSKKEHIIGTPERPLSAHGRATYITYWSWVISSYITQFYLDSLKTEKPLKLSIVQISEATYIKQDDVIDALFEMGALEKRNIDIPESDVGDENRKTKRRAVQAKAQSVKYIIKLPEVLKWYDKRRHKIQGPALIESYCLVRRPII